MDCSPPGSSVHVILQQEYWSGLPFPSPGDLPNPRIKPRSLTLQVDSLPAEPSVKPRDIKKEPKWNVEGVDSQYIQIPYPEGGDQQTREYLYFRGSPQEWEFLTLSRALRELLSMEAFLSPISYRQDVSLMTCSQFQMAEQLIIKGGMARKSCGKNLGTRDH